MYVIECLNKIYKSQKGYYIAKKEYRKREMFESELIMYEWLEQLGIYSWEKIVSLAKIHDTRCGEYPTQLFAHVRHTHTQTSHKRPRVSHMQLSGMPGVLSCL